jgi:hypothetical protein
MLDAEGQRLTVAFLFLIATVTVAYNVWVYNTYGRDATISIVVGTVFRDHPLAACWTILGIGLFLGHILLPSW